MLFEGDCWYLFMGCKDPTAIPAAAWSCGNHTCALQNSSSRRHNKCWGVRGPDRPGVSRDAEGCWAPPGGLEDDGFCQQHVRMPVPLPPGSHWSAQACVECLSSVPCSGSQQPLTFGSMAPASLCCSFLSCKSCKIPLTY